MIKKNIIELIEYQQKEFPEDFIDEEIAERIWHLYSNYIDIAQPSWKNNHQWELIPKGWVGYIPVNDQLTINLQPKVPIDNLFKMLEIAYRLNFKVIESLYNCESINEYYDNLAKILAKRVLHRKKKGLFRKYLNFQEELPYVRGRIQIEEIYRKPWQINLPTQYQEHTSDVVENQLLVWTLYVILRSGRSRETSLPTVRKAYRELQRIIKLSPFSPVDCIHRLYDRLNYDYEPMHAICRFFLENSGPTINVGDHAMIPFLINMASLFEQFVAEWLKENIPPPYQLRPQHKVKIGEKGEVTFIIDLVVENFETGEVVYVLDTKYKVPDSIYESDIHQIVSYAEAKGCDQGILIYPSEIKDPLHVKVGGKYIRTLTYNINSDLNEAGDVFLDELFNHSPNLK